MSMQAIQQQQKNEEIANVKDETIKRVLTELSSLQTPSQMSDTMSRVADLVAPLFVKNFEARKDEMSKFNCANEISLVHTITLVSKK